MLDIQKVGLLKSLDDIPSINKCLQINTINAHSYNVAQKDKFFADVLLQSDVLIPDGQSIVWAKKFLNGEKFIRITGYDLFQWEMQRLNLSKGKCFFLGSTTSTLLAIKKKATEEYPAVEVQVYSPPYKPAFTEEENKIMIDKINSFGPDVLFVGMTAPKQEKWVYENKALVNADHINSIGAVFDFYAGNVQRAPLWMQKNGLEWLFRLIKEPRRMWRRYIIGNLKFVLYILKEKLIK